MNVICNCKSAHEVNGRHTALHALLKRIGCPGRSLQEVNMCAVSHVGRYEVAVIRITEVLRSWEVANV